MQKLFDLRKLQKKGSVTMNATTDKLVGGLVVVVLAGALAPTIFGVNWSSVGAPEFVVVAVPIIIGVGVFYLIWKAFK